MGKVLVICGATASGKTALAVDCAKKFGGEVVSADSLLVYKDLNVGTAKPSLEERQGVPHHMIDVVSPTESFSVSDYERIALPILEKLLSEGKMPVICGGTGFYIRSLLYKQQLGGVGADEQIRRKYEQIASEQGVERLHSILREKDEETADKLHPNDVKRVIRALEIFDITGKPKSMQKDEEVPRFDFLAVSIDYPRELLYERIEKRVDIMFEQGLKEEVRSLLENGVSETDQCMQGIGYKEVAEGLKRGDSDEEIKELIKKNTRNYAKRQLTFFKRMENHVRLAPNLATAEEVAKHL